MPQPIKITLTVLTTNERTGRVHPSIVKFLVAQSYDPRYILDYRETHDCRPAAAARNQFCNAGKDRGADWLCMIDNDMVVPTNLCDTIRDIPEDADIAGPLFLVWDPANPVEAMRFRVPWGLVEASAQPLKNPAQKFHQLSSCGSGVIFIRPRVFQAMEPPYSQSMYGEYGQIVMSEDIHFSQKACRMGLKIYGNSAVSAGHCHAIDLRQMAG